MRFQEIIVIAKIGAVTAVAALASVAMFLCLRRMSGIPYSWVNLAECVVIPLAVAPPILFRLYCQSERLRQEHASVVALSAKVKTAHCDLLKAHERLRHASSHDKMTGLLNREAFLAELGVAAREQSGVLLMADADHFKQINDQLGHLRGDEALVLIAAAIREAARSSDIVGRIGGEEFGILLLQVGLDEAVTLAEAIRQRVEEIPWPPSGKGGCGLSISIGAAAFGARPALASDILGAADRCLYRAKDWGRNGIVTDFAVSDVA